MFIFETDPLHCNHVSCARLDVVPTLFIYVFIFIYLNFVHANGTFRTVCCATCTQDA